MNRSLIASSVLHIFVIIITAMSLPFLSKKPIDLPPIVSIELIQITEKTNIPFVSTWNASDIAPSDHDLYFGRPGLFGNRIANFAVQSCDLLLILGSRLSVPITGYQMKNFSPFSKKIFVDIDKKEMTNLKFTKD